MAFGSLPGYGNAANGFSCEEGNTDVSEVSVNVISVFYLWIATVNRGFQ